MKSPHSTMSLDQPHYFIITTSTADPTKKKIPLMKTIFPTLFLAMLAGCANIKMDGPDETSFSTLTGDTPFHDRYQKVSANSFYIEQLGNGFSNHNKMEKAFIKRANELCNQQVADMKYLFGTRFPDARLPDNRLEECISGKFCNRTYASFPLVFGMAYCKAESQ